jgi:hypothetical protein
MSEENAKVAPNSRCQRSVPTSMRKAKPAPRSAVQGLHQLSQAG